MATIMTRAELKAVAKQQLRGNWGKAITVCLIVTVGLALVQRIPTIGTLAAFLLEGALTLGLIGFFLRLSRGERAQVENVFDGFSRFGTSFVLLLLTVIFVLLWSLLLIVPGIIAGLRYAMAFYILYDNPGLSAIEAIERSKELMRGHKGQLFVLQLSFIGWALLCILTLGIGLLWLAPYIYTTTANFYENLRQAQPPQ